MQVGGINIKYVFYWGIAALALVALAGPYPDLSTWLIVLIIAGVVLGHYKDYIALLQPPAKQ